MVALLTLWALGIAYAALLAAVSPAPAQTGGTTTIIDDRDTDIAIDDRDFEQTCNNVVNIILEDVQNPDVDNNQNATVSVEATQAGDSSVDNALGVTTGNIATGDVNNAVVVGVSQEQVVNIAQELNVSPEIVQTCIQAGRDNIIVREGDRFVIVDRKFLEEKDIVKVEDDRRGRVAAERTDVLLHTVPRKPLPNTGGGSLVVWAGMIALVALYAALLAWRVRRRGW